MLCIRYANISAPHSFPTRRSSDLATCGAGGAAGGALAAHNGIEGRHRNEAAGAGIGLVTAAKQGAGHRSEEHTSELQSLRHLVCRLLLEKKKKSNTITGN